MFKLGERCVFNFSFRPPHPCSSEFKAVGSGVDQASVRIHINLVRGYFLTFRHIRQVTSSNTSFGLLKCLPSIHCFKVDVLCFIQLIGHIINIVAFPFLFSARFKAHHFFNALILRLDFIVTFSIKILVDIFVHNPRGSQHDVPRYIIPVELP